MPVFRLTEKLLFPDPKLSEQGGLLAVGGDLSVDRLLLAYSLGIFPWYSDGSPILWWSPDPRLILIPKELRVSRSLRQTIKKGLYTITFDQAFDQVISNCADICRGKDNGTWITREMKEAYILLNKNGYAHSVEAWDGDELAGGLYGVTLGRVFFGESMFAKKSDASKAAFVTLVDLLFQRGFELIDCQVATRHLMSLGARAVPRSQFLEMLRKAISSF